MYIDLGVGTRLAEDRSDQPLGISGLGEEGARIPFLGIAIVGASIGALRAKKGGVVDGAVKGAAVGVVVGAGALLLLGGALTAWLVSKRASFPTAFQR